MQTIKEQIMDIIRDPSKTHRQTVFALAELADRLCDYPAGIPENFQRLADEEILCDHNDGHAPLCPRYILPDYERFMERCRTHVAQVEKGRFGADMKVELLNDGPFTLMLDSGELF